MASTNKALVLGDFELATLEYLWANDSGNAKAVHAVLGRTRGNSLNTVQSTLDRLYKKGLLERQKIGHAFHYRCLFSRTDVLARKIGELAAELSGGEMKAVFAAFIEFTSRLDTSKIEELEVLIADYKKARGDGVTGSNGR